MAEALNPLTFPPELYKRLVPSQFLSQHLTSQPPIRPDARRPSDFRDVQITTGSLSNVSGSSVARVGSTIMACGVRAEITEPDPFAPKKGFVVPNIDIGPLCHASIRAGPPSEMQQTIAFALLQHIHENDLIDLEDLCIEESKAVWVLYIDVICLSHAGSLLPSASLAMIGALMNVSLPVASWDIDAGVAKCRSEFYPLRLRAVSHVLEFGVFGQTILADMTDEEEALCKETVTLSMDIEGSVQALRKSGGSFLDVKQLDRVLELAEQRVKVLDSTVRSSQRHKLS